LEDESVRKAVVAAMDFAVKHGILISIDLSAAWLITKHLPYIQEIVKKYVNIVFVNEDEAMAFTGKEEKEALQAIGDVCDIAVVKLGARGSLVQAAGSVHVIDPYTVEVVNTNGAGDMYAAGFLHSIANGHTVESAGKAGSQMAALVVASPGQDAYIVHQTMRDILDSHTV
jgi:sugar/nucleoside kinase (ribokinase family)